MSPYSWFCIRGLEIDQMYKMLLAVDLWPSQDVDWGEDEAIYSPALKELVHRGMLLAMEKIGALRALVEDNSSALTVLIVISKRDDQDDILEIIPEDSAEGGPLGQQLGGRPCMTTETGKVSGK